MIAGRPGGKPAPEVHVFLLWSKARVQEDRILTDLAERFRILDVVDVVWTEGRLFAESLSRMYGEALPPGSDKELHCGSGPFLVVVVEDPTPRYGVRRTSRGRAVVNTAVFDARQRYRTWTGGGFRVHASDSVLEAERNLLLLFGEGADHVGSGPSPSPSPRHHSADPVGAHGWASLEELERVIGAYGGRLRPATDEHGHHVVASDAWWVERLLGGDEIAPGTRTVLVAGSPERFVVTQADDPRPGGRPPPAPTGAEQALLMTRRLAGMLVPRLRGIPLGSPMLVQHITDALRRPPWAYPRPRTTVAVGGVAVTTTLVGRALLPPARRPDGLVPAVVASAASYLVLRTGVRSGVTKAFKHTVMDRIGGDVDDAHTWILGTIAGGASLLALDAVTRRTRRSTSGWRTSRATARR